MNNLNMYMASRLMWGPEQNVDALLEDYCAKFYGKSRAAV